MSDSGRSNWILLLLLAGGAKKRYNEPVAGRTRLMKEIFLFQALAHPENSYTFEASYYGPSSREVLLDLKRLIRHRRVQEISEYGGSYLLTPEGVAEAQRVRTSAQPRQLQVLEMVKRQYNLMPLNRLLAYVYARFPAYTEKSRIKNQVLSNPDEEDVQLPPEDLYDEQDLATGLLHDQAERGEDRGE